MPRGIGRVRLPLYYGGMWRMESPANVEVYTESFREGVLEYYKELPVTSYDVVVFVNGGGISGGEEGRPREAKQSLNIVITPGRLVEYGNKVGTRTSIYGVGGNISLENKLRTVVTFE